MTGTQLTTISRHLAACIAELNATTVFNLMGEDTATLVTALAESPGVRVITTRHESAAVMAADSYAWASGGLGIAVLSHGPGFVNGLTGAISTARARQRVLIITGHDGTRSAMRPDLKQCDQTTIGNAAGLAVTVVQDAHAVETAFEKATGDALSGRTAMLSIPVDVLNAPFQPDTSSRVPAVRAEAVPLAPDLSAITETATWLRSANRPLLLAGAGALHAQHELQCLAERTSALLGTTLGGRGLFSGHPSDIGLVGGWASDSARPLLNDVDLVIALGASLNSFTLAFGNLFERARIVQVDNDPSRIGANRDIDLGIRSDARLAAQALLADIGASPHPDDSAPTPTHVGPLYIGVDNSTEEGADPNILATILDELIPEPRTIVSDAGHFAGAAGRYMQVRRPKHFRLTAAFGSIGLGIGAAIGAAAARPHEQTVLIVGDGGMLMSLGDLETVARYQLPLVIVVMNDRALGAERHFLDMLGLAHGQAVFGNTDFAAIARGLGVDGATVSSPAELWALESELSQVRQSPLLVDCKIRGDLRASWLDEMV